MGSLERSKKKVHLWKKAIVHFSLCFVMGFFSGFAPTGKSSIFHTHFAASNISQFAPQPIEINVNRSLIIAETPVPTKQPYKDSKNAELSENHGQEVEEFKLLKPKRLVIIVTPTSARFSFQSVLLRRLANTLKLVSQPLLWIVVEAQRDSNEISEMLRQTGIMYRHLVFKKNFTELGAEMNHQRNLALKHIEHHRLSGIVHFAGFSNVYDLQFFDQLREIEVFGTWPMALLSPNRKKVIIEGPVCDSSQVIGWHLRKMNNNQTDDTTTRPLIHISSFAFNSSILWDPERWGRTSPVQDTSQNSIKFVKQVVFEDETKLKGIPPEGCSKIMLWRLNFFAGSKSRNQVLATAISYKDGTQR
ncbi:Glycosyltransferase [Quillaja saponaria]|uniref:Glycosyltransferases n=1 Tax=Quillaja saponaria TaxID=32244 RepID=A0AAD7VIG6_QUISA|nr:Glycosyltransferase [Quillaja saponaria]